LFQYVFNFLILIIKGKTTPKTVENFKLLASGDPKSKISYKNSDIFRIISTFSVQGVILLYYLLFMYTFLYIEIKFKSFLFYFISILLTIIIIIIYFLNKKGGNIGVPEGEIPARLNKYGTASSLYNPTGIPNENGFEPENYRIQHSYSQSGVVSMMKDIYKKNTQDSRFFITLSPDASWADSKYVAFGRVSNGMNFLNGLSIIPVKPPSNYPETSVKIVDSGCYAKE
jgi:cyclophilin family peptidyl-prolyl cis-trans isomerase